MKKVAALAICMIALIVVPGTGWAAPVWAGPDARNFAGSVPGPGALLQAASLDPARTAPPRAPA